MKYPRFSAANSGSNPLMKTAEQMIFGETSGMVLERIARWRHMRCRQFEGFRTFEEELAVGGPVLEQDCCRAERHSQQREVELLHAAPSSAARAIDRSPMRIRRIVLASTLLAALAAVYPLAV